MTWMIKSPLFSKRRDRFQDENMIGKTAMERLKLHLELIDALDELGLGIPWSPEPLEIENETNPTGGG